MGAFKHGRLTAFRAGGFIIGWFGMSVIWPTPAFAQLFEKPACVGLEKRLDSCKRSMESGMENASRSARHAVPRCPRSISWTILRPARTLLVCSIVMLARKGSWTAKN